MSQKMSAEQLAKIAEFQRLTAELMTLGLQPAQVAMAPSPSPAPPAAPQAAPKAPPTTKLSTGAPIPEKKDSSKLKPANSKAKARATPGLTSLDPLTSGTSVGRTPVRNERSRPLYVPSNTPASGTLTSPPAREAAPARSPDTQDRARSLSGQRSLPPSQLEASRDRTQGPGPARMGPPRSRSRDRPSSRQGSRGTPQDRKERKKPRLEDDPVTVVMRERLPSVIFEGLSRDQTERLTLDREVAETYGFKTEVQPVSANALLWVIGCCLSTGADWANDRSNLLAKYLVHILTTSRGLANLMSEYSAWINRKECLLDLGFARWVKLTWNLGFRFFVV